MTTPTPPSAAQSDRLNDLLTRVLRLHQAAQRYDELNPAQHAALDYLARANRFSRKPSAVAEFLSATRGTVSQTLKALLRKGLVEEHPDPEDKRGRRYDLSPAGWQSHRSAADPCGIGLSEPEQQDIEVALRRLLAAQLTATGGRSFGLCRSCRHHRRQDGQPFCGLLGLPLAPEEADQICQEHVPEAAAG